MPKFQVEMKATFEWTEELEADTEEELDESLSYDNVRRSFYNFMVPEMVDFETNVVPVEKEAPDAHE